jgi:hypothetical protein
VTREPFRNRGRITDLIETGQLFADIGLSDLDKETDRVMMCGSPGMLEELRRCLSRAVLPKAITASPATSWSRRLLRNVEVLLPHCCSAAGVDFGKSIKHWHFLAISPRRQLIAIA